MTEDSIKKAFDKIHTEDLLKQETKQFIHHKIYENAGSSSVRHKNLKIIYCIAAVMCSFAVILGAMGAYLYLTPAAVISIDINPSIELEVNRFDKVISVIGFNDEAKAVIENMDLKYKDYTSVINEILQNNKMINYLQADNNLEISVAGKDEDMLEKMRACISKESNINDKDIYCSNWEDIHRAHSEGLSCGKYRIYLELQNENPDITIEDIKNLSMKEIRALLECDTEDNTCTQESNDSNNFSECTGGHGHKHGQNCK